jgi:hypothetical protein
MKPINTTAVSASGASMPESEGNHPLRYKLCRRENDSEGTVASFSTAKAMLLEKQKFVWWRPQILRGTDRLSPFYRLRNNQQTLPPQILLEV